MILYVLVLLQASLLSEVVVLQCAWLMVFEVSEYCSEPVSVPGDYAGFPGCGLLRLHSTYRHDLKIYASDEGRVQMTAAAFAKVLPLLCIC